MNNRRVLKAVWVAAVCGLAMPAFAQDAGQGRRDPAARPDGAAPALEGPRVNRVRPAGVGGDFGGGEKMGRDRIARRPAPMRAFWESVKVLDQDDTPDALRLSPEQHEQIESLLREQRDKMMGGREGGSDQARRGRPEGRPEGGRPEGRPDARPERDEQREAMSRERGAARAARPDRAVEGVPQRAPGARPEGERPDRGPGRGPEGGPQKDGPQQGGPDRGSDRARERGAEGRPERRADGQRPEMAPDGGPEGPERRGARDAAPVNRVTPQQIEEYQTRAWAILNDAQRAVVQAELDRIELEGMDEQMDRRVEEYLNKRREGAAKGGDSPEGGFAGKGAQNADRRAELAKKLSEMSPEERKVAIERLRAQMRKERGEPRPAPSLDSLRDPE